MDYVAAFLFDGRAIRQGHTTDAISAGGSPRGERGKESILF